MKQLTQNNRIQYGFTLIEVMVAVSVFAIILTVGIGSLLTINNAYRKSQTERVVIDSLSFAVESMARELRTGYNYTCAGVCDPSGSPTIKFINSDGDTIAYSFDFNGGQGRIVSSDPQLPGGQLALTDPSVVIIDDMKFFVVGEDATDSIQPYVIITVTGTTAASNQQSQFTLETSVSQRLIDRPQTP